MNEKKSEILKKASAFSRAFREIVLEADPKDLEEAIAGEGEDPHRLAETGKAIVAQALRRNQVGFEAEEQEQMEVEALHEGLSALIQLLRRSERDAAGMRGGVECGLSLEFGVQKEMTAVRDGAEDADDRAHPRQGIGQLTRHCELGDSR